MSLIYFIILAFLPSVLWLAFFMREDRHPEPKRMILKVFVLGMLSTFPVIILGVGIMYLMKLLGASFFLTMFISIVFVAAITEEIVKYLVVKFSVLNSSECDEPTDLMIYAITAALGFAALENILFLFPGKDVLLGAVPFVYIREMFTQSIVRFVSGTFLHALAGGIMGYFLALSILYPEKRKKMIYLGLGVAILLHGLYNFSIIIAEVNESLFLVAPIILIILFATISICFSKIKKMASICNLNNNIIKKNEK